MDRLSFRNCNQTLQGVLVGYGANMIRTLIVPLALFAIPASAQQPPPQANALEQVMANKIVLEVQAGLQCAANWLSTQRALETATAELTKKDEALRSMAAQLEELKKSKPVPPLATPIPKAESLTPPVDMAPEPEEKK